jgi:hypothetical protein
MNKIKAGQFDEKTAKLFVSFALRELGVKKKPNIKFTDKLSDISQHGSQPSFGAYDPTTMNLLVYRGDRHRADILRSLAHELVHHAQKLSKEELNGKTGSDTENTANATAGVLMRKFTKVDPNIMKTVVKEKQVPRKNKPSSREWGTSSLVNIYKKDTPGQLAESGPAKDVTLIAVPKDKNDLKSKAFWKIGSEVYRADEHPQFDSMGHPIGKRWESTYANFAEAWDEAFAEWFEKTPAWTNNLHESAETSTWDIIQESTKFYFNINKTRIT